MENFEIKEDFKHVLNKPLYLLTDEEKLYKRSYARHKYKEKISKMSAEDLILFRKKAREANRRFYNGRKEDHKLVLLLKEKLLD